MADDQTQRPFRAADGAGRPSSSDPLAELARLIGQNDPFGEFGRENARRAAQQQGAAAPAAAQPMEQWAPQAGAVPGYAPGHPAGPAYPAAASHQVPEYAQADIYHADAHHTDAGAPGYAPHDEAGAHEAHYSDPNLAHYETEDHEYYDEAPPRRRMGVLAIAAVFALAVLGTAAAFGYRALFGSVPSGPPPVIKADTSPSKIVPPKNDSNAKLIQDRAPQPEKLVTREEKPIDLQDKPIGVFPPSQPSAPETGPAQGPVSGSGVVGSEPRAVHTITIRPDQANDAGAQPPPAPPMAAEPAAPAPMAMPAPQPAPHPVRTAQQPAHSAPAARPAPVARTAERPDRRVARVSSNAPLSLNPNAPTPARAAPVHRAATHVAAATPRQIEPQATVHTGSGYAVQVSSRRSQADAEAAFRSLQAKYPGQLGGHHALIRRVDPGQKGVYYRAMVGPFANHDAATKLCSSLKAAGGSCFVQRI